MSVADLPVLFLKSNIFVISYLAAPLDWPESSWRENKALSPHRMCADGRRGEAGIFLPPPVYARTRTGLRGTKEQPFLLSSQNALQKLFHKEHKITDKLVHAQLLV